MNRDDSPTAEADVTACFFCGKTIVDGHWFARLRQGTRRVIFCRPYCVELFLEQSPFALAEWSLIKTVEY